jgi:hypothetical protein
MLLQSGRREKEGTRLNRHLFNDDLPNFVVEWLTLLVRIREVPGSNLARSRTILIEVFRSVSKSLQANAGIGHDRFLPHPFQFIIRLPPFHSTLYSALLGKCR